jgi:hypothetical protein
MKQNYTENSHKTSHSIVKMSQHNDTRLIAIFYFLSELMESIARFGTSAKDLMSQAAKRQQELTDPAMRDDLVTFDTLSI